MIDVISGVAQVPIYEPKQKQGSALDVIQPVAADHGRYGFEWDLKSAPDRALQTLSEIRSTSKRAVPPVFVQSSARQQQQHDSVPLENTVLNHEDSTISAVIDDCIELHVKPGTLQQLEQLTQSYSDYLESALGTSLIGAPQQEKRGLHIHVDIHDSFKDIASQGRFICAMFNLAPVLMAHSRVGGIQGNCRPASADDIKILNQFIQKQLDAIQLPDAVMKSLKKALGTGYGKEVAINLQHSHFGQAGTYELRFLQSPASPQQLHSLIKLVDRIVAKANGRQNSLLFREIKPQFYTSLEAVLEHLCDGDHALKQEWAGCFSNKPRPVTSVDFSPNDPRAELASLVKQGDELLLDKLLSQTGIHFDQASIARALSAKERRVSDADCERILSFNPKQQLEYDRLIASSVNPALALKSVGIMKTSRFR